MIRVFWKHPSTATLVTNWYNQRHEQLINTGVDARTAEAIVTIEMSHDVNAPRN